MSRVCRRAEAAVAVVVVVVGEYCADCCFVYLIAFELAVVAYYRRCRCHLHLVVHLNCEHELVLCSE